MKRVTLADVARHCGVSTMTVSCVTRGMHCVKESTRIKVEAAIKELGYVADPTLRALASYRTQIKKQTRAYRSTLAYLDSEFSEFSQMMFERGVEEAASLGYGFKYFEFPFTEEGRKKLSQKFWLQGIRGIVLGPSQDERHLKGLEWEHFSIVGIGAFYHLPPLNSVSTDYFQNLYLAVQKCKERGYQTIAFYMVDYLETRTGHRWLGAYHTACDHYHMSPKVWLYPNEKPPSEEEFLQWIKREKIDAVLTLCGYPPVRPGVCKTRFVSLNDWHITPGWWYILTPQQIIIREAVRLLDQSLLHQEYGIPEWPKLISIRGQWIGD